MRDFGAPTQRSSDPRGEQALRVGAAAAESNYGILASLVGPRGFIGNVFARVGFKCLRAAIMGMFGFEKDERGGCCSGELVAKPPPRPEGALERTFRLFPDIVCYQGMKDEKQGLLESHAVTRSLLRCHLTSGKVFIENLTTALR